MSSSSYPSPVSSPGTSARQQQTPPMVRDSGTRPSMSDPVQTQNNLRDASVALEAAYHRIRQVRRSLLQLQGSIPLPASPNSHTLSFGPRHDAILLAGSSAGADDDAEYLPSDLGLPPLSMDHLSRYELDFQRAERTLRMSDAWSQLPMLGPTDALPSTTQTSSTQTSSSSPSSRNHIPSSPVNLNSPISPIPNAPPRRTALEIQLSRRHDSDDPHTTLGRRVAARESGNRTSLPTNLPSRIPTLRRILESGNERQNVIDRSRGPEPLPFGESVPTSELIADRLSAADLRIRRSIDTGIPLASEQVSSTNPPPNTLFPPRLSIGSRRWRASREARLSSVQSPASTGSDATRLSILSNFSIANISSPVSALSRERPLIFEEPMPIDSEEGLLQGRRNFPFYSQPPRSRTESLPPLDTSTAPAAPPGGLRGAGMPSYLLQRQYDADGQEVVHQINMDSEVDDMAWAQPLSAGPIPVDPNHYVQPQVPLGLGRRYVDDVYAFLNTATTPHSGSSRPSRRRRRGWARLDPDGNEIPSDEEEELERARTEGRIRALYQNRVAVERAQSQLEADLRATAERARRTLDEFGSLRPQSPPTLPYEELNEYISDVNRINESRYMDEQFYSSDSIRRNRAADSDPKWRLGPSNPIPFEANPLPMPLEAMIPPPRAKPSSMCATVVRRPFFDR